MLIDIVILPPKDIREKIGAKMKKEIGHLPNFFVVDNIRLAKEALINQVLASLVIKE